MAYRNLTVDGQKYKWTVGKTHLKVQGFDAVAISAVGTIKSGPCSCGGFSCDVNASVCYSVGPAEVAKFIRERRALAFAANKKKKAPK